MEHDPPQPPRGAVARWEALPAHRQFIFSYVLGAAVLLVLHLALFTRISTGRAIGYAVFEALPLAGLVVLATQSEIARRRQAGGGGPGADGGGSDPR